MLFPLDKIAKPGFGLLRELRHTPPMIFLQVCHGLPVCPTWTCAPAEPLWVMWRDERMALRLVGASEVGHDLGGEGEVVARHVHGPGGDVERGPLCGAASDGERCRAHRRE
jgi:hypothetical protein